MKQKHRCHVPDCDVETRPEMLMCKKHWNLVPLQLRLWVNRTYRDGQCNDKKVSKEWLTASRRAIDSVRPQRAKP